ncbi:hypothetical protein [uncultured Campylobacter sp.]|uniref:hypothetical protein n=1 Tax=uncultured Campylobacter sp. TaxID=218934 RepID=UPI0028EF40E4|nr:hypothetical protein [uncultured Campylobacter sp.]
MNITQTQISALYVGLFGRSSEGAGSKAWLGAANTQNLSVSTIANTMLDTVAAKEFFGDSVNENANFVEHIYANVFGKGGANLDKEGKAGWTKKLNDGEDRGKVAADMLKAACDPVHSNAADEATKNAHNLLINKIIASNVVADLIKDVPNGGDIKEQLKAFIQINKTITPHSNATDIKSAVLAGAKSLNLTVDEAKLDAALDANSKVKIISGVTGKTEDEISKELAPKPALTPDPKPAPAPDPKPQPGPKPTPTPDPKPQPQPTPNDGVEGSLKQMLASASSSEVIGYSAKIEHGGKKYFVSIRSADNDGVNLSANQKINLSVQNGAVKTTEGKTLKADVYTVKNFPTGDSLEAEKGTAILGAFTKDGHEFSAKDQENGVPYSHSLQPRSGVKFNDNGFFERPFGLVEGTTDGVSAQKVDKGAGGMVYKLVKDGQTTYYVTNKEAVPHFNSHTGTVVIEGAKPGDKVKFAGGADSLTQAKNEDGLQAGAKQFIKDGDDTILYANGKNAGFSNSDDLKIVFKGVSIDKAAKDGAFTLKQNVLADGAIKATDAQGFTKLFDDAPALKLDGTENVYKKEGKFYQDAQATKPLDADALNVKAVKFANGDVYTFRSAKKSQSKDAVKGYDEQSLSSNSQKGDALKSGDTTYEFFDKGNVAKISSDDFTFENGAQYLGSLNLDGAKNITKESFLSGKLGDKILPNAYSNITTGGVKFELKQNGDIKSLVASFEKAKEILSGALKDRIADGAVELSKDSALTNAQLQTLAQNAAKFANGAVKSAVLSAAELTSLNKEAAADKIANSAVTLTDKDAFSKESLKALGAFSDKLKDSAIAKTQKLSAADFYEIFGKGFLSSDKLSSYKIADGALEIEDSANNLQNAVENRLNYFGEKIKSIKTSDGAELKISATNFNKIGADKFDANDNIKLTGVSSNDKDAVLSDKVDSFEINRTLEVSVDEYAKFAAKLAGKGKFDIADDFKKIMKFLKTADVSKIETLNLSDKNIELSASDVEELAKLNDLNLHTKYGTQITLKQSAQELNADGSKLLKAFAGLSFGAGNAKKQIDVQGDGVLELDKDTFETFKFAADDNLKITNVTGSVYASDAKETFTFKQDASRVVINALSNGDKLDFSKLASNVTSIGDLNVAADAQTQLQDGKIYYVSGMSAGFASGFDKIFGEGKAFLTKAAGNEKSIILAKTYSGFEIYKVENNGDNAITKDEVKYIGSVSAHRDFNLSADNIVLAAASKSLSAAQFATEAAKGASGLNLLDTAENIKQNLANLISNKDKIVSISSSDDKPINLTASQLGELKGKFAHSQTLKISEALKDGKTASADGGKYIFTIDKDEKNWQLEKFGVDDKLDFSKVFDGKQLSAGEFNLNANGQKATLQDGKIYKAELSFTPSNQGGGANSELDALKKVFEESFEKGAKALLIAKNLKQEGNSYSYNYVYKIEDDGNGKLDQGDIKLLGVVNTNSGFQNNYDITAANAEL